MINENPDRAGNTALSGYFFCIQLQSSTETREGRTFIGSALFFIYVLTFNRKYVNIYLQLRRIL